MKNNNIQKLLKIISAAKVVVVSEGANFKFVMFNNCFNLQEYNEILEEKKRNALFNFASNIPEIGSNFQAYTNCIARQFKDAIESFNSKKGIEYYKHLSIVDNQRIHYPIDQMDAQVRKMIVTFLKANREIAIQFVEQIEQSNEPAPSSLKSPEKETGLQPSLKGPNSQWLDNSDICRLLNISPQTLKRYRYRGIIPFSTIGSKCLYNPALINELLEKGLKNSMED